MSLDMISTALKWTFFSLLYLAITLTAMVVCLGMMAPYLPVWGRWAALAAFLGGVLADVHVRARPRSGDGPADGKPVRVPRSR